MTINEVRKKTGLTKKAINYYEQKGLITPKHHPENKYRDFSEQDLKKLAVIAFLRQLNIPVEKIRGVVDHKISIYDLLEQQLTTLENTIASLKNEKALISMSLKDHSFKNIDEINIDQVLSQKNEIELNQFKRENAIHSQWQKIFPGKLGRLFALIYNAYLIEPIDSQEKRAAWYALIDHLDNIDEIEVPPEIEEIIDSKHFEKILQEVESTFKQSFERMSRLDKNQIKDEIPSPPQKADKTPEKVKFMKNIAALQKFLREELHIYLSPVTSQLEILSSSYKTFIENMSQWANIIKSREDFKPLLELYGKIKKEFA
ncbi:MAG: MerR family transcriptional regulator [bacterium]